MKLLRGLKPFTELENGAAATIGNFDGVHVGHQALIKLLQEKAKALGLPVLVILFEPQPAEYFYSNNPPARLTTLRDKVSRLKALGVDYVYCLTFDKRLAQMEPQAFVQQFLFSLLNIRYLLIGQDFRFGRDRCGDMPYLQAVFAKEARTLEVFSDFKLGNARVSSTKIREALAHGNLDYARELLGRNFSLCRRVIKGDGRGRQWGIPTANFTMLKKVIPLTGVYCVKVIRGGNEIINGVANIGCRPTVDGTKNVLEVHLLDFDQTIYGELLDVVFLKKLRDEIKFSSLDDLIDRIRKDIAEAREFFSVSCA